MKYWQFLINEQTQRICRNWYNSVIHHCRHCVGWLDINCFWDALIPLYLRNPRDTPWDHFLRKETWRKIAKNLNVSVDL
jgi:hypothetical protein